MVLPSSFPTIFLLPIMLPSFNYYIYFVFSESVNGIQWRWSLLIVCVSLNATICCICSSQPQYVLLCVWRIYSESSKTVLPLELKRLPNCTYFGCKFGDEDKPWVPHICWVTFASKLKKVATGFKTINAVSSNHRLVRAK
jgi:hypothetical protein